MVKINGSPSISIIVPVYNSSPFLRRCVDSLLEQTLQSIEVILMDDGSTDQSGAICDEYAAMDSRVKVIHQANAGPSNARNNGTKLASAPYITYVDGDDWLDIQTCKIALDAIKKNDADVVFWGLIKEYRENKKVRVSLFDEAKFFESEDLRWLHRRMVGMIDSELREPTKTDAFNSGWGKLYKKELIMQNDISFFDTREIGSEDVLFNINVFYFAKRVVYIPYYFSHYRQDNMGSITKTYKSTLFPKFLNLFGYIHLFIENNKLPNIYQHALNNRIALSVINVVITISNPNNPLSVWNRIRSIKQVLAYPLYDRAIRSFSIRYLPWYWKFFFILCKWRMSSVVYVLALIMRRLRKRH